MSSAREIQTILAALEAGPAALATLIAVQGSSYRQVGARCLVLPDGRAFGSISGGCLEQDVRLRARNTLESGTPQVALYDTASENDLVWGTGLGCQGQVRVFFERLPSRPLWIERLRENFVQGCDTHVRIAVSGSEPRLLGTHLGEEGLPAGVEVFDECIAAPPSIVIYGAGDDAIPLVEFAWRLGWHSTVLDARAAYATPERFPLAQHVAALAACEAGAHASLSVRSYVIVMSHRYRDDLAFLGAVLERQVAYLGVLGPRRRTDRMLEDLAGEGRVFANPAPHRLYAPIGLDLGGASPESVALSIIAELQAIQHGRTARHLRDRAQPIHGS